MAESDTSSSESSILEADVGIRLDKFYRFEEDGSEEVEEFSMDLPDLDQEFADAPDKLVVKQKIHFGTVTHIVNNYVIVSPANRALICDFGTLVFAGEDDDRVFLKVWEVFGPVLDPYYSLIVRQGFLEQVRIGSQLYYSPETTSFVSKESLMEARPLDVEDTENPEFSDDEQERLAKRNCEEGECR